jgi:hypothetical protein
MRMVDTVALVEFFEIKVGLEEVRLFSTNGPNHFPTYLYLF